MRPSWSGKGRIGFFVCAWHGRITPFDQLATRVMMTYVCRGRTGGPGWGGRARLLRLRLFGNAWRSCLSCRCGLELLEQAAVGNGNRDGGHSRGALYTALFGGRYNKYARKRGRQTFWLCNRGARQARCVSRALRKRLVARALCVDHQLRRSVMLGLLGRGRVRRRGGGSSTVHVGAWQMPLSKSSQGVPLGPLGCILLGDAV